MFLLLCLLRKFLLNWLWGLLLSLFWLLNRLFNWLWLFRNWLRFLLLCWLRLWLLLLLWLWLLDWFWLFHRFWLLYWLRLLNRIWLLSIMSQVRLALIIRNNSLWVDIHSDWIQLFNLLFTSFRFFIFFCLRWISLDMNAALLLLLFFLFVLWWMRFLIFLNKGLVALLKLVDI